MAAWGLLLAGCSEVPKRADHPASDIPSPQTLRSGELRLATSLTYAPMYIEQTDGTMTGFGYELSNDVGDLLDLRVDRVPCASQTEVLERVSSGEVDLGGTSYERGALPEDIISCDAGIACNISIVDHNGTSGLVGSDLHSVEGVILVQDRLVVRTWVETQLDGSEYELMDDPEEILQNIREDHAIVGVVEQPVALYYLESLFTTLEVVETVDTGWSFGFVSKRESQSLMDAVNQALTELRDEGTTASLETRWFGGPL